MEFVHQPDGSVQVIDKGTPGTLGWLAEFEYCVGKVVNPFESQVANIVMGAVFQAVTYQMWLPAVGLVCSGVASGRNHQNKQTKTGHEVVFYEKCMVVSASCEYTYFGFPDILV